MQLTLTRPIEAFIERQLAQGYKDADEVARQALLRWMSEESEIPPNIQSRLDEAASGRFAPGDRSNIVRRGLFIDHQNYDDLASNTTR